MADDEEQIIRHTYTRARRFTQWVRWIMGWQLPIALQAAQFVTGAATLVLLIQTRSTWGSSLPWWLQITLIITLPTVVAIATRYLRTDGTGPAAVFAGLVTLVIAPVRGRQNGKTVRSPRAHRIPTVCSLRIDLLDEQEVGTTWSAEFADELEERRPEPAVLERQRVRPTQPRRATAPAAATAGRALSVAEITRAAQALAEGQFREHDVEQPAEADQDLAPAVGQ